MRSGCRTGTTRLGWTFNQGQQWQLSPFAYGVAQGTLDGDPMRAHVEAGVGLALRFRFRFDRYWGYQPLLKGHFPGGSRSAQQRRRAGITGVSWLQFAFVNRPRGEA